MVASTSRRTNSVIRTSASSATNDANRSVVLNATRFTVGSACTGEMYGDYLSHLPRKRPGARSRGGSGFRRQAKPRSQKDPKTSVIRTLRTKTAPIAMSLKSGAGGGNRTRDSCLEGKGITIMQRPRRRRWWAGLDSNQRTALSGSGLQPDAFNHSTTYPRRRPPTVRVPNEHLLPPSMLRPGRR